MVELEEPPELIGIEAAPVSQNSSGDQTPPPFPSRDATEDLPELSLDAPPRKPQTADEPLELPELIIEEPADEASEEFPPLDPIGPESETTRQQPEPPIVELMVEPLVAPKPPAWLSVQATLEAEIEELRQQQEILQAALADSRRAAEEWKEQERAWREQQQAWNEEKKALTEQLALAEKAHAASREQLAESDRQLAATQKRLENSKREADDLQQQMKQLDALLEESQTVNKNLKSTLKQKLSLISRLENDARKAKREIEELRSKRRAVRGTPQYETPQYYQGSSIPDAAPSTGPAPALLPPLPEESYNSVNSDLAHDEPIVPRLAGRPDPPSEAERPVLTHSTERRTPLIPADVSLDDACRCTQCGAYLDSPPEKKGLIYDLKDWYHEWRDGKDSCSMCEPICTETGLCTQTDACCEQEIGLIPRLIEWCKHRREECDCDCVCY
jgi:hypothetical protein